MKQIPRTEDLAQLGTAIHDHGFGPNEHQLTEVADLARMVRHDWPVLDMISDRSFPEVVRARALARLGADWPAIQTELESFRSQFEADLAKLLDTWNEHQDLRSAAAPIAELARSRDRLDALRHRMGRYQQAVSR